MYFEVVQKLTLLICTNTNVNSARAGQTAKKMWVQLCSIRSCSIVRPHSTSKGIAYKANVESKKNTTPMMHAIIIPTGIFL